LRDISTLKRRDIRTLDALAQRIREQRLPGPGVLAGSNDQQ
jgi:hypothetical protein